MTALPVALMLLVAQGLPAQAGVSALRFEPCGNPPRLMECATLAIPERHHVANSRRLALRVVRIRQHPRAASANATFVLGGGPGQAAPEFTRGNIAVYETWAEYGDVVFMDQRGTEDTSPLRCPVSDAFDPFAGIFPLDDLTRCRGAAGRVTDLAVYGTSDAARDLEFARVALGYRQLNLVGLSYGSRLALEYLERHPEGARAAILDGVAPRELRAPLHYVADAEGALAQLSALCLAQDTCRRFGAPLAHYRSLMARLASTPARVSIRTAQSPDERPALVGPEDLAYGVRGFLYNDAAVQLPRLLAHADSSGDLSAFARQYAQRVFLVSRGTSTGLHLSVFCAEDISTLTPAMIRAATAGTIAGSYLPDQYVAACQRWRAPARKVDTLTARVTQPVLLFSGALDPVTPPRWGEVVRARAINARHVVFPYGAHGTPGFGMAGCKDQLVREFLRTADLKGVDTRCLSTATPPPSW